MKIPEGMTEQEVVDVMNEAASRVAPKYKFGYHNGDDMIQQAVMKCVKILNNGKFIPKSNKDLKKQLLNFLITICRNEASNYRRKHSFRYASPDSENNKRKYNIMHPMKIHSQGMVNSEIFSRPNSIIEDIDKADLINKIRDNLPIPLLKDYLKWMNGVKIPLARRKILFTKLAEIFDGYESTEEE